MKLAVTGALAATMVFGGAAAASAAVYGGYRDCPSGKVVQLASLTKGKTVHYYNGTRVLMQTLEYKDWRYSMTAPAIGSYSLHGAPLYSGTTYCRS